ncbi:MAG: hypothetical protein F6J93_35285 [Oscillatoria sp. SIO1A7]|nr:hypothetical protein [Oscillatoria sp. SIO1A7]
MQTTAAALGVNGEVFFQTSLVQTSIQAYGPGAQGFLQAAEAQFRAAGIFSIDTYNNEGFVSIVNEATSLSNAIASINGLSVGRIRAIFVTRTITLFRSTFSGARFRSVNIVTLFIYKASNIRAINFPPARDDN